MNFGSNFDLLQTSNFQNTKTRVFKLKLDSNPCLALAILLFCCLPLSSEDEDIENIGLGPGSMPSLSKGNTTTGGFRIKDKLQEGNRVTGFKLDMLSSLGLSSKACKPTS